MTVWDEVKAELGCDHARREVRYSTASNGTRQYREQCLDCGDLSQFLRHADPRVMRLVSPTPVDEQLRTASQEMVSAEVSRRLQAERQASTEQTHRDWWESYTLYLETPQWRQRSRRVLARDDYLCQSCLNAPATQAHHLNYKHVFEEPLFELVAVCDACHRRITELDRAGRVPV